MTIQPMLATAGPLPSGPDWAYEFKWDGVRCIAGAGQLFSRAGTDMTAAFPELALPDGMVLDGELVALGPDVRPAFTRLAERIHVQNPVKAARLAVTTPVTYMIFDLLGLDGRDLTAMPYHQRRSVLEGLGPGPHWLVPPSFTDGAATVAAANANALEGVVAKRLDSPYRPGERSPDWVKVKPEVTGEFVVGGWRPGARLIGALLLGLPSPDGLRFVGRVGTGISVAVEQELLAALEPTDRAPFDTVPRDDARGAIWTRPGVVVEVGYDQVMPDGRLRFPRLVRLRPDKTPADAGI